MKKRLLILLTSFVPLFSSCNRDNGDIKTICPLGAPSIAFYDQGNNSNFVTTSTTATILAQFQRSEYDAIVVDSTNGLKAIKQYNSVYRFAKLLTASNLYLVSKTHDTISVDKNSTICAFGSDNSVPYLTLKTIYNIDEKKVDRNDGVTSVLAKFKSDTNFDYYVLAEPALTTVSSLVKGKEQFKVQGVSAIPQAALFINKDTYKSKASKFTTYINELKTRVDNSKTNKDIVYSSLNSYGDETKVKQRFGLPNETLLKQVQANNGLGVYNSSFGVTEMNSFLTSIGQETYSQDYFINI